MANNINTPAKKRPSANKTDQSIDIKIPQPVKTPAETDPELHVMAETIFGKSSVKKLLSEPSAKPVIDSSNNSTESSSNHNVTEMSAEELMNILNPPQDKSENPLINIRNELCSATLPKENFSKGILPTSATKAMQKKSTEDKEIQKSFDKYFDQLLSSMILRYGIALHNCLITVRINKNQIQYMRNIPGKILKNSWKTDKILYSEHELILNGKRFEIEEYCSRIRRSILGYPATKNITIDKENIGIKLIFN